MSHSRQRRSSLRGWWNALPIIVVPFSILFYEVWLKTNILNDQYEANKLQESIRLVKGRIDSLEDNYHDLVRIERIDAKAPDLGLRMPEPGQTALIADQDAPAESVPAESSGPIVVARSEDAPLVATEFVLQPLEDLTEMD